MYGWMDVWMNGWMDVIYGWMDHYDIYSKINKISKVTVNLVKKKT